MAKECTLGSYSARGTSPGLGRQVGKRPDADTGALWAVGEWKDVLFADSWCFSIGSNCL